MKLDIYKLAGLLISSGFLGYFLNNFRNRPRIKIISFHESFGNRNPIQIIFDVINVGKEGKIIEL